MDHLTRRSIEVLFIMGLSLLIPDHSGGADREISIYSVNGPQERLIGENIILEYKGEETLADLGRRYDVGHLAIGDANLSLEPDDLADGNDILIPTSWIIPELMDEGILINLAELRLYFFRRGDNEGTFVSTFPIGIGREGFSTPTGDYEVMMKIKDPAWYPHASTRARNRALPFVVPPGPDNPLGPYWIELSLEGYGIHGTKTPSSIGKKISLGCIRLLDDDLEWLFERTYRGMPVKIINRAVKIAFSGGTPYLEVHRNGLTFRALESEVRRLAREYAIDRINPALLDKITGQALGIPVPLTGEISLTSNRNIEGK